jgi:hypothetical protein
MYMQQLLARMDADLEGWKTKRKAHLEQMKADRIADRECMKQMMARTDYNRKRDWEDLKRMMKEMDAKMDTN